MQRYRQFLGESYDRLDSYLRDLQAPTDPKKTKES
jgi:hypothetical protein